MNTANPTQHHGFDLLHHNFDVCVVGGGVAGMCAALAAARRGANTCLIHDRPVLGGNASSEIRMWICGAHGMTESGLLEEIKLDNAHRNPGLNYSIWDSVLWGKVFNQPNLTCLLNTSVTGCDTEAAVGGGGSANKNANRRIASVLAWQLTSQTWHRVGATLFIDCSGDSILARPSGAETRWGRESRADFGETIPPETADRKTMGNSLLIQTRRNDTPQSFTRPEWAYRFESPDDLPHRIKGVSAHNFWWIELGGLDDTIGDSEAIRDELMKTAWGVWDYIKNVSPAKDEAANWSLEWLGSLPGKRENRRYVGDHTMTEHDVRAGGDFPDVVAYGGWSMDDHHPAGMLYPGKPTLFHDAPSPYGIPYRTLYSRNVDNLLCAGRNISVTHAALSSCRVMGTCAVLGQAAGTAAAICIAKNLRPASVFPDHVTELQTALMDDDATLPGHTRAPGALARAAQGPDPVLADGTERSYKRTDHLWRGAAGSALTWTWDTPTRVGGLRMVLDSSLNADKRQPCAWPQRTDRSRMPGTLVKSYRIEAQTDGVWQTVHRETDNRHRLVRVPLNLEATAVRLVPESSWNGADEMRIYAAEPTHHGDACPPPIPRGAAWRDVVAAVPAHDLAAPDSGLENPDSEFDHGEEPVTAHGTGA